MLDVSLIREVGPVIAFVFFFVQYVLSPAIKQVGEIGELAVQGRNAAAVQPLDLVKTSLEIASKDRDRLENRMELLAEAVTGLRADTKELSRLIKDLTQLVKGLYP